MNIMELYSKWSSLSIVRRVMVGLVIGLLLSLIAPGLPYVDLLGDIFISALRAVAPFLVLLVVMNSLSRSKGGLGRRFQLVVALYLISSIISAIVAVAICMLHPVVVELDIPAGEVTHIDDMQELVYSIVLGAVTNPVTALAQGNYLGLLFWAIIFGLVMKSMATEATLGIVDNMTDIMTRVIEMVINFAPLGVLGLVYDTISTYGVGVFAEYGELIGILVISMLIVTLVTNPILSALVMRSNPYKLQIRCLKDSGIPAFCTRSSAANIPVNLKLCDDLGVNREFSSVSIPLGSTVNMDGAAITITVLTLVAVNTLGMEMPFWFTVALCMMATVAACGSSGVSGGSLLLVPLACSLFGIGDDIAMQVVAIGFTIGVIQDSLETALNSSSDVLFTAVAEVWDRRKNGEKFKLKL